MGGLLKQYMWIANLIMILICSYFCAKIVNVYIGRSLDVRRAIGVLKKTGKLEPVRTRRLRNDYNIIIERNMFDSSEAKAAVEEGEVEKKDVKYIPGAEAVRTSLPVKVVAVLVVGNGKDKRSSSTISMGKGSVDVYSVRGEKSFSPGVVLVQIKPDRIEFINKGRLEYAELEETGIGSIFGHPSDLKAATTEKVVRKGTETTAKLEEGKYLVDQREIDNALTNLDKLYTEIRAVPNFQDGRVTGMKVLSVKPGSLFSKLGLKRGDILSRINGIELDVKRGFDIFSQLKDQKSFNLDLVRGGTTQTFEYEIR